ncbi:MAG: universal stress protein [Desulfobacteraceae bacterium]|nr:universal stress protein [Desulfobacteraceae bacterium]
MSTPIRSILFATNLSQACVPALTTSVYLAAHHNARLVLLHVVDSEVPDHIEKQLERTIGRDQFEKIKQEHEHDAQEALIGKMSPGKLGQKAIEQFCLDAGLDPDKFEFNWQHLVVADKDLVGAVLKQADEHECNLIVAGSKKGFFRGQSIGSTVKGLLEKSKIPVLVVPPGKEE